RQQDRSIHETGRSETVQDGGWRRIQGRRNASGLYGGLRSAFFPVHVRFVLWDFCNAWSDRRKAVANSGGSDLFSKAYADDAWQSYRNWAGGAYADRDLGGISGIDFGVRRHNDRIARRASEHTRASAHLFRSLFYSRILSLCNAVRDGWF